MSITGSVGKWGSGAAAPSCARRVLGAQMGAQFLSAWSPAPGLVGVVSLLNPSPQSSE